MVRWSGLPGMVAALLLLVCATAAAQGAPSSSFAQLPGRDGCVRALGAATFDDGEDDPLSGCAGASGLGSPQAVVVAPDERQVLVAAGAGEGGSNGIVALDRSEDNGALTFASCVSEDGGDGRLGSDGVCTDGDGLSGADAIALSPDGASVFVTSRSSSSLTWFDRDPDSGQLSQAGCLRNFAWPDERCTTAPLLSGASGVAVSPDGELVFVTAATNGSLSAYRRDVDTGELERVGCISDTGSDGLCENGEGLRGAGDVAVSPEGDTVVVGSAPADAVTTFAFDPDSGALSQTGCFADDVVKDGSCTHVSSLAGVTSIALSPDGTDLYAGAADDAALTAFHRGDDGSFTTAGCVVHARPTLADGYYEQDDGYIEDEVGNEYDPDAEAQERRDAGTDGCTPVRALDPSELAISADGAAVFAGGDEYLDAFGRDPDTGKLGWLACAQQERAYRSCTEARGLPGGSALATSTDGRSLYVASTETHSVAVFAAALDVSATARVHASGVLKIGLRCPAARPVACRGALRNPLLRRAVRYVVAPGHARAVTARLKHGAARRVHARRLRGLAIRSTDWTGFTAPARRHVALRWFSR